MMKNSESVKNTIEILSRSNIEPEDHGSRCTLSPYFQGLSFTVIEIFHVIFLKRLSAYPLVRV